jgi:hypothetical protein
MIIGTADENSNEARRHVVRAGRQRQMARRFMGGCYTWVPYINSLRDSQLIDLRDCWPGKLLGTCVAKRLPHDSPLLSRFAAHPGGGSHQSLIVSMPTSIFQIVQCPSCHHFLNPQSRLPLPRVQKSCFWASASIIRYVPLIGAVGHSWWSK